MLGYFYQMRSEVNLEAWEYGWKVSAFISIFNTSFQKKVDFFNILCNGIFEFDFHFKLSDWITTSYSFQEPMEIL